MGEPRESEGVRRLAVAAVPASFFALAASTGMFLQSIPGGPLLGTPLLAAGVLLIIWSSLRLERFAVQPIGFALRALLGLLGTYGLIGLPAFAIAVVGLPRHAADFGMSGFGPALQIGMAVLIAVDLLLLWFIRLALKGDKRAGFAIASIVFAFAVLTLLAGDNLSGAILIALFASVIAALVARVPVGGDSADAGAGLTSASS